MTPSRKRLATILSLDVAGYSRAAEHDDEAAADKVRTLRATIGEVVVPFDGRIFNTAGDGFMLEFPSAASGVEAAVALLKASKTGESALPRIRIGVHLGDVIAEENGDLLGHGVNVAARLQALAEPGTALISESVRAQVRSAADVPLVPQGRVQLDKMSEKLAVYAITSGSGLGKIARRRLVRIGAAALVAALVAALAFAALQLRGGGGGTGDTPRLAVLRFEAVGETPTYFAEGVADELITEARLIQGLEVSARSSSFALAGADATPQGAAERLNATHVLTGSVQRMPNSVRVHAELVSARDGRQLWSETFESTPDQAPSLQREIALRIAAATRLRVAAAPPRNVDPAAFDLYLQALDAFERGLGPESNTATALLRRALARDPRFAEAWALLADSELRDWYTPIIYRTDAAIAESMRPALDAADRALELNPHLVRPYEVKVTILMQMGRWREAQEADDEANRRGGYGRLPRFTGRFEEGRRRAQRALDLDPLNGGALFSLMGACESVGDRLCARTQAERYFALNPEDSAGLIAQIHAQAKAGDLEAARQTLHAHSDLAEHAFVSPQDWASKRALLYLLGEGPLPKPESVVADFFYPADGIDELIGIGRPLDAVQFFPLWPADGRHYLQSLFLAEAAPIRETPEFWALVERFGLLQYWRESGRWPDFCRREPVCAQRGGPAASD